VWTLVDGDDGDQYLLSGFHFVNRIGYLVSTVAVPEGLDINVRLPMQSPCDGEAVEQPANSAHEATPFVTAPKRSTNALSTAGATAAVTRLLVPMGEALVPGQMYLRLYHGRTDPDEQMDDWGFVGPTFGPLACYVHTYCCTFRMHSECSTEEIWLDKFDDMIRWDGRFYGDMEIFIAKVADKA
jgi:hypothetical protein